MNIRIFILTFVAVVASASVTHAQDDENGVTERHVVASKRNSAVMFLEYISKDKEGDFQITEAANLRNLADQAGYDGHSPVNLRFVVPEKAIVVGKPGGGVAIDTGDWPENAIVTLIIKGNVYGGGGNGGNGGPMPAAMAGGPGGDAIFIHSVVSIAIAKGGSIKGGGGGGGGGSAPAGGGGGGGGFPNGEGGKGANAGSPGRQATLEWGGRGGNSRQNRATWSTLVEAWSGVPDPYHSGGGSASGGGNSGKPAEGGNGGEAATDGYDGNLPDGHPGGPAGYAIRVNGFNIKLLTGGSVWGKIG